MSIKFYGNTATLLGYVLWVLLHDNSRARQLWRSLYGHRLKDLLFGPLNKWDAKPPSPTPLNWRKCKLIKREFHETCYEHILWTQKAWLGKSYPVRALVYKQYFYVSINNLFIKNNYILQNKKKCSDWHCFYIFTNHRLNRRQLDAFNLLQ